MGHTILLADDSITIQKVIELTFSDEDFKLHTVGNGQKAIEDVRTVRPDIVLCDIIMPEKSGYEVCEFIKTHPELKHIPVLLLTGAFEPFDQERARQVGCNGFLAKPFEPQTLISKVRELLASSKRPAPQAVAAPGPAPTPATQFPTPPASPVPTVQAPPPARPAASALPPTQKIVVPTPAPMGPVGQVPPLPPPVAPRPTSAPASPGEATVVMGFAPPPSADVEDFAYEVGARELSVDAGDRNILLEESDDTPVAASEDIWSEVQSTPPASARKDAEEIAAEIVDDSATVMMKASPASPGLGALLGARRPPPEPVIEPADPELTPVEGFSGFDAFSTTEQASLQDSAEDGSTMMFSPPTPAPQSAWDEAASWEPVAGPTAASTWEEDVPTVRSVDEASPPTDKPGWGQAAAVPRSPDTTWEDNVRPPAPGGGIWDDDSGSVPVSADWQEDETPVDSTWDEPDLAISEPMELPKPSVSVPPAVTKPVPPPAPVVAAPAPNGLDGKGALGRQETIGGVDERLQRELERIVSQISEKVIQEIAWEVIPDLAEAMIRREIEAIKAKIPK